MPHPHETIQRALELYEQENSITAAAKALGIPRTTVRDWVHKQANGEPLPSPRKSSAPPDDFVEDLPDTDVTKTGEGYTKDVRKRQTVITCRSRTIHTLDGALEYAGVDLEEWEVDRYVINKWDCVAKTAIEKVSDEPVRWERELTATELWQVKVWLKRIETPVEKQSLQDFKDELLTEIREHAPEYPAYPPPLSVSGKYLLEISLPDLHFGKLSWAAETGEDYDCEITEKRFREAIENLLSHTSCYQPERILFPVGNDFLHIDNLESTTAHGTRQDVDTRPHRIFRRGWQLLVEGVDRLAEIAPVDVVVIPGNHDTLSMFHVGEVLDAWYHKTDRVQIDNSPRSRKYVEYGQNLLGFCHGGKEDPKPDDLPLIMATQEKEAWARTTHHEFHLGHFHTKRETKYLAGDTHKGVIVRVIPSLCGTDKWHFDKGFVENPRAAEAYLYDHEAGYRGHYLWQAVA